MSGAAEHVARVEEALERDNYISEAEQMRIDAGIQSLAVLAAMAVRGEEGEPEDASRESPGVTADDLGPSRGRLPSGSPSSSEATAEALERFTNAVYDGRRIYVPGTPEKYPGAECSVRILDAEALLSAFAALMAERDEWKQAAGAEAELANEYAAERDAALARAEEWERAAGAEAQLFNEAQRWAKDLRAQLEAAREALREGVRIAAQYLDTGRGDLDGWVARAALAGGDAPAGEETSRPPNRTSGTAHMHTDGQRERLGLPRFDVDSTAAQEGET